MTGVQTCALPIWLQTRRLSNCGSQAQLLRSMWDPPRPGLEPVSPASAGRFSTTAPPGKPLGTGTFKSPFQASCPSGPESLIEEEAETQRGSDTCWRTHSWAAAEQDLRADACDTAAGPFSLCLPGTEGPLQAVEEGQLGAGQGCRVKWSLSQALTLIHLASGRGSSAHLK